ncbi:flagellar type III secretion system pore protein FliP [Butyrivibrio sp. NC2002]|uniref:flagellar type III secretion system pore protein FliP n=1 Tax=Butyrivibrio sp. NC2002 TaxID=1410610 RepID=UPI000AAAA4BF|nr:flagellar type III secretion system pore protein FliP [Butyrivibrio sp. NC2002]
MKKKWGMNDIKPLLRKGILCACLCFVMAFFLFEAAPQVAFASTSYVDDTHPTDPTTDRETNLTGTSGERTNITDPGSARDSDDLKELNIANTVTVTYDNGNGTINGALRILITLTLIALAPTILIMMTCFTRIIIVLHFTRSAIGTQTSPPNQVLLGLALILTFFIMQPTIEEVYKTAIVPFENGEIDQQALFDTGMIPIREFMYGQTQTKDVRLFMEIDQIEWDGELDSIPNAVLVPSFLVSELRTAFIIGFLIYVPFIVIDMVVSSVLMSMGMMMLPPTTISLPFKILLFVLADGWNLLIGSLVKTFY